MQTIVASWNHKTESGKIHLSLDSRFFDADTRYSMAEAKVAELEAEDSEGCVEVIMAHAPSLDDFKLTDPRFLDDPKG